MTTIIYTAVLNNPLVMPQNRTRKEVNNAIYRIK